MNKKAIRRHEDPIKMIICSICGDKKLKSEMSLRKLVCRKCVQKQHHAKYRARKRIESIPKRNRQLYKRYLERKERHWSIESLAKMFQISVWKARNIIAQERKRAETNTLEELKK